MKYQVIGTLKVRTPLGVKELKPGDTVVLPEDMALRLIESGKVKPSCHDCFSPDGTLEVAFREAEAAGWTDEQLCSYIDALWEAGALKPPWGLKVRDSPFVGDFWIISDTTARERLPTDAYSFTLDELRPIVEVSRVFPEAKVIKVIRAKEQRATS